LTCYAQEGNVHIVTGRRQNRGYGKDRRCQMAPFIAMIASIGIGTVFGILAFTFGTDSRPTYGDDHAR
jgi:hypothetical protein